MRAVGIVRVSQAKGREGESFASPGEQRERIEDACERESIELLRVEDELDVSGGTPLEKRRGLRSAVEAVEAREADVVMVAYFDRLVRSLRVQDEVVSRVEAAGGRVVAIDFGEVTGRTAAQWLSGTMIGAVSEYYRRSIKERSGEAQAMAVARGVVPFANLPPGYDRGEDGRLVPNDDAPAVAEAFAMRARGETVKAIRAFLASRGIKRSFHGVGTMLSSRVVLGEIHFGKLSNLEAHEPIVERDVWQAVQRVKVPRGRRATSDRLLARLGVLRCATCDARMVVGTTAKRYPIYRCPSTGDCPQRVAISATIVEGIVVSEVRRILADAEGSASADARAREAEAALERAQADLDAAVRAFAGLEDEASARERLGELRELRNQARAHRDQLGGLHSVVTIRADADWDLLTLDEQRALVRATLERVTVEPGRGADRVTVESFV